MESRHLFADEQLVVAAPAIAAVTCRPPAGDRRQRYHFSMESGTPVQPGGAGKADRPRGPAPERLHLVLEAVRLGPAWRWSGAPWWRGDSPRRAGAAHRRHRPLPWHYWLTVSPQAENRPEVARFIAAGGGDRPLAPADQRLAFGRRRQARPGGVLWRDARNRARRDTDRGAGKTVRPPR
nr:Uncharacterised protein [Klebsiella pneumoniae]